MSTALKCAFLLMFLFGLSESLFYSTSRPPKDRCFKDIVEDRPIVEQTPNKGCLTPDQLVYCELDWNTGVQHVERHVEVCCDGYASLSEDVCVPKCLDGCVYGSCVGPDMCFCVPGYTGLKCDEIIPDCEAAAGAKKSWW